jgi:hypothetical protein
MTRKIEIQNVNHPGKTRAVDFAMYEAMRKAFLKVVPKRPPGITADELRERVLAHLPETLFPDGARAGWWTKAVQLDLEAKGVIARDTSRPIRFRKA